MQVDVGILLIERHSSHNGELVLRLLLLSQSSVFVALTGCCLFTFVLGWINEGSIVKITINIIRTKQINQINIKAHQTKNEQQRIQTATLQHP